MELVRGLTDFLGARVWLLERVARDLLRLLDVVAGAGLATERARVRTAGRLRERALVAAILGLMRQLIRSQWLIRPLSMSHVAPFVFHLVNEPIPAFRQISTVSLMCKSIASV